MRAQQGEGGGRILLGDNTGGEVVMLWPIRLQCAGVWVSAGLSFILTHTHIYIYIHTHTYIYVGDPKFPRIVKKNLKFCPPRSTPHAIGCSNPSTAPNGNAVKGRQRIADGPWHHFRWRFYTMFPALEAGLGLLHPIAGGVLRGGLKFQTCTNTLNYSITCNRVKISKVNRSQCVIIADMVHEIGCSDGFLQFPSVATNKFWGSASH
jgi:hypothetical protein